MHHFYGSRIIGLLTRLYFFGATLLSFCILPAAAEDLINASDTLNTENIPNISNTSTTSATSSGLENLSNYVDLGYRGVFDGPSVVNRDGYVPDNTGKSNKLNPVKMTNNLFGGYRATPNITIGGFFLTAWEPNNPYGLRVMDPALRVADKNFIKTKNLKVVADLRLFIPTTTVSRNTTQLVTGIQSFHVTTYKFGTSRWSIRNYSSLRYNFLKERSKGNDVLLYLAPNFDYKLSQSVAASLYYGINLSHKVKDPFRWKTDRHYVGPGVNWNITPTVSLSPVLTFLPENPRWATTTLSGFLVAKIL